MDLAKFLINAYLMLLMVNQISLYNIMYSPQAIETEKILEELANLRITNIQSNETFEDYIVSIISILAIDQEVLTVSYLPTDTLLLKKDGLLYHTPYFNPKRSIIEEVTDMTIHRPIGVEVFPSSSARIISTMMEELYSKLTYVRDEVTLKCLENTFGLEKIDLLDDFRKYQLEQINQKAPTTIEDLQYTSEGVEKVLTIKPTYKNSKFVKFNLTSSGELPKFIADFIDLNKDIYIKTEINSQRKTLKLPNTTNFEGEEWDMIDPSSLRRNNKGLLGLIPDNRLASKRILSSSVRISHRMNHDITLKRGNFITLNQNRYSRSRIIPSRLAIHKSNSYRAQFRSSSSYSTSRRPPTSNQGLGLTSRRVIHRAIRDVSSLDIVNSILDVKVRRANDTLGLISVNPIITASKRASLPEPSRALILNNTLSKIEDEGTSDSNEVLYITRDVKEVYLLNGTTKRHIHTIEAYDGEYFNSLTYDLWSDIQNKLILCPQKGRCNSMSDPVYFKFEKSIKSMYSDIPELVSMNRTMMCNSIEYSDNYTVEDICGLGLIKDIPYDSALLLSHLNVRVKGLFIPLMPCLIPLFIKDMTEEGNYSNIVKEHGTGVCKLQTELNMKNYKPVSAVSIYSYVKSDGEMTVDQKFRILRNKLLDCTTVPDGKGVDGLNCEHTQSSWLSNHLVMVDDRPVYLPLNITLSHIVDPLRLSSYNCTKDNKTLLNDNELKSLIEGEASGTGKTNINIKGDNTFCKYFKCMKGLKLGSTNVTNYFCMIDPNKTKEAIQLKSSSGTVESIILPNLMRAKRQIVLPELQKDHDNLNFDPCHFIDVKQFVHSIKLSMKNTSIDTFFRFINIRSDDLMAHVDNITNRDVNINIPTEFYSHGGFLELEIFTSSFMMPCTKILDIRALNPCNEIETVWSLHTWNKAHCYAWWQWIIISILIAIIILLLIMLTPLFYVFFYGLYLLANLLWRLFWKINRVIFWRRGKDDTEYQGIPLNDIKVVHTMFKPSRRELYNQRRKLELTPLVIILVLCIFISSALGCTKTFTLSVPLEQCSQDKSNSLTCDIIESVSFHVYNEYQETCYILKTPLGLKIGFLKIISKQMSLSCNQETLYYTPNKVKLIVKGESSCPLSRNCGIGNECCLQSNTTFIRPDLNGCSKLNILPEESSINAVGCDLVASSAYCILPGRSCQYWSWSLLMSPHQTYTRVFRCTGWEVRTGITVEFYNQNGFESKVQYNLKEGEDIRIINGTLGIISSKMGPISIENDCFGELMFYRNRSNSSSYLFHISNCNMVGSFQPSNISPIQCSLYSITSKSLGDCRYSHNNLISCKVSMDNVKCSLDYPDILQISKINQIPLILGDNTLISHGQELVLTGKKFNVEMGLQLHNLRVINKFYNNRCSIIFLNVTGCSNCQKGARINVRANTNFGNTLGHVLCKGLKISYMLPLNPVMDDKHISFIANSTFISDQCELICPDNVSPFKVEGKIHGNIVLLNDMLITNTSTMWSKFEGFNLGILSHIVLTRLGLSLLVVILTIIFLPWVLRKFYRTIKLILMMILAGFTHLIGMIKRTKSTKLKM